MNLFTYLKSKEFLRTLITVVVIVIILIFGLTKWLDYFTKHDEKIKVPNLEKLSLVDTENALNLANLNYHYGVAVSLAILS